VFREAIPKGVEIILGIIANYSSARDLLASRARVSQSLSAIHSMTGIYKLSTIENCLLSSKTEEIFGVVETTTKIEELIDVDQVKSLSNQDFTCSSEITHIEAHFSNMSSKASKFKVTKQDLEGRGVNHKMREDLTVQEQDLLEAESKLKSSLKLKKKEAE